MKAAEQLRGPVRALRRIRALPDTWMTDVAMGVFAGAVAGSTDAWYQGHAIGRHAALGAVWFAVMIPIAGRWRRRRARNRWVSR
jgi:hypothetical protein